MARKKYALTNSYFKNRGYDMPGTILEIAKYREETGELPFEYHGDNWVYEAFCERQKRSGVYNSQFLTPDATASRMMHFAGKYFKVNDILEPCCGTGQITKEALKDGYVLTAFDFDRDMVDVCKILYPGIHVFQSHFNEISGTYNQIIANPPYEIPVLTNFLIWILSVQESGGISILLIPQYFIDKEKPKALTETLAQFRILEREDMYEEFLRTKIRAEIVVIQKK